MKWINTAQALALSKRFLKAPHTKQGIRYAAIAHNIGRKQKDGHHWKYDSDKLYRYLELRQYPTLSSVAKQIGSDNYHVRTLLYQLDIHRCFEMGMEYLEYKDASKLINYHTELNNGKTK